MMKGNYKWLPHLENSIPDSVGGYTSSLYAIALEGWRRGLNLKFIKTNRRKSNTVFELSDGHKTHRFVASRGDLVSREALHICKDKAEAKKYLLKARIPTPDGKDFAGNITDEIIIEYVKEKGFPLVIKPLDGTGGRGVIAGIENLKEFKEALKYVRYDLGYKHIIVEDHFEGEDYRVYVVDEEVVAATKRIPANITGDGTSTIKELIKQKNQQRRNTILFRSSLINIDRELKNMLNRKNYTLSSIPSQGERVFLKSKNNISSGGDPVDITEELTEEIKQIAVKGLKAIPGLPHGGLDLMVNKEENKAVIIEINSQASIRLNLFPLEGQARDVPSKIIDYYFPNTISNHEIPLYFDFGPIWSDFRNGLAQEFKVPNVPQGELVLTRFIVSGKIQRVGYASWVRRQARELNVHGYAKHLRNNTVVIVVCGTKENINKFRTLITQKSIKKFGISRVIEKERSTPVAIGFEIINVEIDKLIQDGYHPVRLKDPVTRLKSQTKSTSKRVKKNKVTNKTNTKKNRNQIDYKREYHKVINSNSWKITKPLRIVGRLLKNR